MDELFLEWIPRGSLKKQKKAFKREKKRIIYPISLKGGWKFLKENDIIREIKSSIYCKDEWQRS